MKTIIAGGRDFEDFELLVESCKSEFPISEVVSGGAKGADRLGERFAKENNIKIKRFPPDWEKFGRSAGFVRNREMANYADSLIAFWDGKSKGTNHMIKLAKHLGLKVKVIKYNLTNS